MTAENVEKGAAQAVGGPSPIFLRERVESAKDVIQQFGEAIYRIDLAILEWNEQLKRAQPHRQGRIIINMVRSQAVRIGGTKVYEVAPLAGKMIQMKSGTWRFMKLRRRDNYERLSDLRVGKSLPSDRLVKKIIDKIEDLLIQRKNLLDVLVMVRMKATNLLPQSEALYDRTMNDVAAVGKRVKLDWTQGAAEAERKITERNKANNTARKRKAESLARGS